MGQIDLLLAALAQEPLDVVAAAGEGGWLWDGLLGAGKPRRGLTGIRKSFVRSGWAALCGGKKFGGVHVPWIKSESPSG